MPRTAAEVRRRALWGATSVTLAAQLAGCTEILGPAAKHTDTDATAADDSDIAHSDTGMAPTDDADTGPADSDTPDTDVVDAKPDCSGLVQGDALFSCCDDLAAWCLDAYPDDLDAQNTCHFGPSFDGSTGCIPWGPPAPPRARRVLA